MTITTNPAGLAAGLAAAGLAARQLVGAGAAGPRVASIWYTRCPVPTASSVAISGGWLDREFEADQIAVRSLGESQDPAQRLAHHTYAHPGPVS